MNNQRFDILGELSGLRRTVRRRLLLFGVCGVLSGGCLSLLTVIVVDWLLDLPPSLRVLGAAMFVIGFGLAALHWIVRPLQTPLSLGQIAGKIEQYFGGLDDRLTSTVSFLGSQPDAIQPLARHTIDETSRMVGRLPLRNALTLRPLLVQVAMLAIGLMLLTAIVAASPRWIEVGVRRYVQPFGDLEWPRRVEIIPLTQRVRVAVGESVTVKMRVGRGAHVDLRGVLRIVDGAGNRTSLAMHREVDGTYRCDIDAVTSPLTYWFEAGDASTRKTAGRIEVAHRPAVAAATAEVHPPPYARGPFSLLDPTDVGGSGTGVSTFDLQAGPAAAVYGSEATVTIRTTTPVGATSSGAPTAWLVMADGARVPLVVRNGDRRRLSARLRIDHSLEFHVRLIDRHGFGNHDDSPYHIDTRPDAPPTVTVEEPSSIVEVTPTGSILLRVRAIDDFGFSNIRLVGLLTSPNGQGAWTERSFDIPLLAGAQIRATADRVTAAIRYDWRMASLEMLPSSTVVCRIEATDNRSLVDLTGQLRQSSPFRIRVIGQTEFESRTREDLDLVQRRLRRIWLEQHGLLDDTMHLSKASDGAGVGERDKALRLASRQVRLARRLRESARRMQRLHERTVRNLPPEGVAAERLQQWANTLAGTAKGPMAGAARSLKRIADTMSPPVSARSIRKDVSEAIDQEQRAIDALQSLIQQMDGVGGFQSIVAKAADLFDRQQALRRQTKTLARLTLGKRPEELAHDHQSESRRLERLQRQLAKELEAWLHQLRKRRERQGGDKTKVGAVDDALRAATYTEVSRHMADAAEAIQANRMSGAAAAQRRAGQGLERMLAELRQNHVRQLAELSKRLEQAERTAAHILAEQVSLHTTTTEAVTLAAVATVLTQQATLQNRLARNTDELATDLGESTNTFQESLDLHSAARAMRRAAELLAEASGHDASLSQETAIELLRDVVDRLSAAARRAAHAAAQKMMAVIHAELEDILVAQELINAGTTEAAETIARRGRLDRTTARRIAALTRSQAEAKQAAERVQKKLARSVVYHRVVGEAVGDMASSYESLGRRKIDKQLDTMQRRIARRIGQLVRALHDARELPSSDAFAENAGGGGGQGGASQSSVPGAAELLMLKTMQTDLMADTMTLGSATRESEAYLRAADELGRRQRELRELTELVAQHSDR